MKKNPPKFKVGQVVSVRSYYGNFHPGECGLGFKGKHGWRHGFQFGKIVKVMITPNKPPFLPTAPHRYFLDGWMSAQTEDDLRPVTKKEVGVSG